MPLGIDFIGVSSLHHRAFVEGFPRQLQSYGQPRIRKAARYRHRRKSGQVEGAGVLGQGRNGTHRNIVHLDLSGAYGMSCDRFHGTCQ